MHEIAINLLDSFIGVAVNLTDRFTTRFLGVLDSEGVSETLLFFVLVVVLLLVRRFFLMVFWTSTCSPPLSVSELE